eukprot:3993809-Pyramimonas_sp.AAC.1
MGHLSPGHLRGQELRSSFRRQWPDHLSAGHLGTQRCEDVSGEGGQTIMGKASPRSELWGCLRRQWPDHLSSEHVRCQNCEDISGESGPPTSWVRNRCED